MTLRRSDRDLSALSVLGLLFFEPRYTFEMYRMMIDRRMDFLTGIPRTLYHAVDRLARDDLIRAVSNERPSVRPERTIFAITETGRVDLTKRVRRLLEHPEPDARLFRAALSFIDCLSVSEATTALQVRQDELERLLDGRRGTPEAASQALRIGSDYETWRLDAEHLWVVHELYSGRLHEPGSTPAWRPKRDARRNDEIMGSNRSPSDVCSSGIGLRPEPRSTGGN